MSDRGQATAGTYSGSGATDRDLGGAAAAGEQAAGDASREYLAE